MSHLMFALILYVIFLLLLAIPFTIIWYILRQTNKPTKPKSIINKKTANIKELERRLDLLLNNNKLTRQNETLQQQLDTTPTHIIASYLRVNPKDISLHLLYQQLYERIKIQTPDYKIIKIMRRLLPACSTAHLLTTLKSYKTFLSLSFADSRQKELQRELNHNNVLPSLLYLENKLSALLKQIEQTPPPLQQTLIENAVTYSLIFASFSQFYNAAVTEHILNLSYKLSPQYFKYWHQSVPATTPHILTTKPMQYHALQS